MNLEVAGSRPVFHPRGLFWFAGVGLTEPAPIGISGTNQIEDPTSRLVDFAMPPPFRSVSQVVWPPTVSRVFTGSIPVRSAICELSYYTKQDTLTSF